MKFIYENQEEMTFGNVEDDQFFYNKEGYLCQKCDSNRYHIIAEPNGRPWSSSENNVGADEEVGLIIPKVEKIRL